MKKTNRVCHTCGKPYYYCYSCPTESRPLTYIMFDCDECQVIWDTLCEYGAKRISASEAYEKLKDMIPEDYSNYSYGCRKYWKEILDFHKTEQDVEKTEASETAMKEKRSTTKGQKYSNKNSQNRQNQSKS